MSPIRIALADDHPVVLAGVKALLQAAPDFEVVGEAVSGRAALDLFVATKPDVAVIDISMPDINGLDLAETLAQACPQVKLLALTVHEDRAYVQRLLQAGARGYLLKRSAADDLARAIRAIASGGIYLDPSVAERALADPTKPNGQEANATSTEELSAREGDVLKLTAQGFTNKEIALRLEISIKTVETYKARAAAKLGLRTRAEIVRYGVAQGWLEDIDQP
ncbi:response regulator transcription factor [Microvirga lenta]|uniref:response regulator transcription factor n=1 Tax=Microvirga lenta TaxID=2881337 RepID=UPI001D001803|nr:response regulator transcription factor [Microvirga lenta]MCB5177335.1 response regulator transcription factor [Microvirga lenta]